MYADKIQFYCMESGVVDLAAWCLKLSTGAPHASSHFPPSYRVFAPLIKANAWLFRHRLEPRIRDLESRRKEGAAFVQVGFEGAGDMGTLAGA
jgi:hypothetical protein